MFSAIAYMRSPIREATKEFLNDYMKLQLILRSSR